MVDSLMPPYSSGLSPEFDSTAESSILRPQSSGFSDDFDNEEIHGNWTQVPQASGSIVETDHLALTVPAAVQSDWSIGTYNLVHIHMPLVGPVNFMAYVHVTITGDTDQGGGICLFHTDSVRTLSYQNRILLFNDTGVPQFFSVRFTDLAASTGLPAVNNPQNAGQASGWIGIMRMGDWCDFFYSLNSVDNEPGVNDWTEQAFSSSNFSHFGNSIGLGAYNFQTLPGTTIQFRKFRLLYF